MTLQRPIVAGATPPDALDYENRGGAGLYDPITKSTVQNPSVYLENNVCGDAAYIVYSASQSVNELVDCEPVLAGNMSISGRMPAFTDREGTTQITGAELSTLLDEYFADLKDRVLIEAGLRGLLAV